MAAENLALAGWVDSGRELDCALILDDFFSHYAWSGGSGEPPTVSAAGLGEDVDKDPIIILDGLSKNWRYPGLRVSWVVGPRAVIEAVTSAGSFLDGGAARPLQRAAVELLTEERARGEAAAIQAGFRPKRELMLARLKAMGVARVYTPKDFELNRIMFDIVALAEPKAEAA